VYPYWPNTIVVSPPTQRADPNDARAVLNWKLHLFCHLQEDVGLTTAEKKVALTMAFNFLVEQIRGQSDPPVNIRTDQKLKENTPRLYREIELAYNLQPRPSNDMIMELGTFALSAAASTTTR
jgi:hypothetical protein